jgi:hypothetical protein
LRAEIPEAIVMEELRREREVGSKYEGEECDR